jgi:hypothetical protein
MGMLRDIFGPSKKEVWMKLADEMGANYVDGGFWKGDKVEAVVGEWKIILDTYTVSTGKSSTTYTRMRAPYVNPDGFRFKIYRAGIFSEMGKVLGMQDIEVGCPEFDDAYIIKGENIEKVRELFSKDRIRELIQEQPEFYLEVKNDEGIFGPAFPLEVDELYFHVYGIVKDIETLKGLFEIFTEVLNQLCLIGSAYKDAPDVSI